MSTSFPDIISRLRKGIRTPGISLAEAIGQAVAEDFQIVVGSGVPAGTEGLTAAHGLYFRDDFTDIDAAIYLTRDTGTTWSALPFTAAGVVSGGTAADIAGENLVAGDVLYVKAADGKLWKHVGTEVQAAAIVGVCSGTFASAATGVTWHGPGSVLTIAAGKTAGDELYAKETCVLATYANVTSSNWTRVLGTVLPGALRMQVSLGGVLQKP